MNKLPKIFIPELIDYQLILGYYKHKYGKTVKPENNRRSASVIRPFTNTFDYKPANILSDDETYIKVKGINHYVWIIMDAGKKSILGYQVSDTRAVGPCILAMRMAFKKIQNILR